MEDLSGILSSCLSKFRNLKALEFHGPPASLPPEQRQVYISTVVAALRYVPLPKLTELNVAFPITHKFGRFFPDRTTALHIPIDEVLEGLQHLGLYVCAQITTNKNVQGYVIPAEYADHQTVQLGFIYIG